MRYVAFDVETPNRNNNRISAIGISVIEDGAVRDEWFSLIDPETHFDCFNMRLTGLDKYVVSGAPTFPEAWEQIGTLLESGIVVAHNALTEKDLSAYDDVLFISKSIGTTVAAGYSRKYELNARHIFFTPLPCLSLMT